MFSAAARSPAHCGWHSFLLGGRSCGNCWSCVTARRSSRALSVVAPALPLCHSLLNLTRLHGIAEHHPSAVLFAARTGQSIVSGRLIVLPPLLIGFLSALYVGTLLYFAARLGWLLRHTITLVREAEPVSLGPENEELWRRTRRAFSVESALILKSQRAPGPVAVQFDRPVLLLPDQFLKQCTQHDFLAVLAHECAHVRRRDFQKNVLYEFGALFIAFHPVTWIVKAQIAQTREMVCDGMATDELIEAHTYIRSLLRLVTMIPLKARAHISSAVGIFDANALEKRIMILRAKKQKVTLTLRYGLVLAGAMFLLSVAGGSAALTQSIQAKDASTQTSSDPAHGRHHKDLSCTYYDAQDVGHPGTCGIKKTDKNTYYCFRNDEKKLSQLQIGCASKLGK